MNYLFKHITLLIFTLVAIPFFLNAQEYLNPGKGLSLNLSSDTLYFKDWLDNKLQYKIAIEKGSVANLVKFSSSGNFLITSGTGPVTNIYKIDKDGITLVKSLRLSAAEFVFGNSEKKLYLLHSRSLFKTKISSFDTNTWSKLADAVHPFWANHLTINASDDLLGFCEGTNMRILRTANLKNKKIYRQKTAHRLFLFNPKITNQAVSVNKDNHILIRDIEKDSVLMKINAHHSKIVWLKYSPNGKLLVSLDKNGNLFTWMPSSKQSIAHFKGLTEKPVFDVNGTLHLSSDNGGKKPSFIKLEKNVCIQDSFCDNDFKEKRLKKSAKLQQSEVAENDGERNNKINLPVCYVL